MRVRQFLTATLRIGEFGLRLRGSGWRFRWCKAIAPGIRAAAVPSGSCRCGSDRSAHGHAAPTSVRRRSMSFGPSGVLVVWTWSASRRLARCSGRALRPRRRRRDRRAHRTRPRLGSLPPEDPGMSCDLYGAPVSEGAPPASVTQTKLPTRATCSASKSTPSIRLNTSGPKRTRPDRSSRTGCTRSSRYASSEATTDSNSANRSGTHQHSSRPQSTGSESARPEPSTLRRVPSQNGTSGHPRAGARQSVVGHAASVTSSA